ncbi:hypothetical protein AAF712_006049 [Marasmius tenuissimus]|uniref:Integrase catalytic domain-containing protein n=1 Tax=Marasmius tenuissimus TaxID=585030 RepID=A0ABR3A0M9_9AGAR
MEQPNPLFLQLVVRFREDFHALCDIVNVELETASTAPVEMRLRDTSTVCVDFLRRVQQHERIFQEEEFNNIRESLLNMIQVLDEIAHQVSDPPDRQYPLHPPTISDSEIPPARGRGRPRVEIDPGLLQLSVDLRRQNRLAQAYDCSARTVRRRALEEGLVTPGNPVYVDVEVDNTTIRIYQSSSGAQSDLSDDELDQVIGQIVVSFPTFGRRLIHGHLKYMGLHIPRSRVEESYRRVIGAPLQTFGIRRITRRIYTVAGPNSLWHHDGQHSLIKYKIVIHAFIDGFSRFVTGIQASNNNLATTVLDVFIQAVEEHGCPSRTRGDHGTENLLVAEFMEEYKGLGRGSYLWGKSIHNIRIERLWRDVTLGFGGKWKLFFQSLEQSHGLNARIPSHIWLLHHLFLDSINEDARCWAESWNRHPLTSLHMTHSPQEMFVFGMIENGVRGLDAADENVEDLNAYGIDFEEMDEPRIFEHHAQYNPLVEDEASNPFLVHAPSQFSHVEVEKYPCPFTHMQLQELDTHLQSQWYFGNKDMESRALLWDVAVEFCARFY